MNRIETISEITKKYTKRRKNGGVPLVGMANQSPYDKIEMLHDELHRLHDIASGRQYFDYEDQKWIDAV